ncbi:MAG: NAD(+)/NADH kinase [Methanomassiliicoccales archaeon]
MKLGFHGNTSLPAFSEMAGKLVRHLRKEDQIESETARVLGMKGVPLSKMDVDVLIVLGGDGTMLRAFMRCDLPLFGINAGKVGFLTQGNAMEMDTLIPRLRAGLFEIEEAMKLSPRINGRRKADAVNEAVVHSSDIGKVRHFNISIGRHEVGIVRADGIIISTPTGSTSYSLAAGGPIVDPSASVIVVSPIAPYGISSRPIVCAPDAGIRITIEGERPCKLVIDGQVSLKLSGSEVLEFTASKKRARFVRLEHDFYSRIRSKLTV